MIHLNVSIFVLSNSSWFNSNTSIGYYNVLIPVFNSRGHRSQSRILNIEY